MVQTATNVSVGKPLAAGGIHAGPIGTQVPTSAIPPLNPAIKGLGYCSDSGLTNSIEMETSDITAWGGDTVLSVRTSRTETFAFSLIESLNIDVLKEVYGQHNVSEVAGEIVVKHNGDELPNRVFVFEILMTGNKVKRIVVPNGKVTEVGEVAYTDGDAVGYETTLTCYPDSSGNTVYEYIASIDDSSSESSSSSSSESSSSST